MLISASSLQTLTDHWGVQKLLLLGTAGTSAGSPVAGTNRYYQQQALAVPVNIADAELQQDLDAALLTAYNSAGFVESLVGYLGPSVQALSNHIARRGGETAASITSLLTYLNYLNTTPTGTPFATMLSPEFADLWNALYGKYLKNSYFYSRGISPNLNATYTNGMGARAVGGSFVAGSVPDLTKYAEVNLIAVVTTTFSGGTAPPTVTVTGTDSAGLTTQTWTGTLVGNNPATAVSTTTSAAITTPGVRNTAVPVASSTGIVPGAVIGLGLTTPQQEYVVVEAVGTNTLTFVTRNTHPTSETVATVTGIQLTPGTSGVRARSVTNLVLGLTGHAAGAVRIEGVQDRAVA